MALHRADLLVDLGLTPSLSCPKCVINYIDPDQEDACLADCCKFDFEEPTSPAEILREWSEDVLREAYRTAGMRLYSKWAGRLNRLDDDRLLANTVRLRHIFPNYDLEELGRILDALRSASITLDPVRWRTWMNDEEYALLLLKQSTGTE